MTKKETALTALSESQTISEAAQKANVSRTTLYSYLQNPDFKDELKRLLLQDKLNRFEQLYSIRQKALDELERIIESGTCSEKLRAIGLILQYENDASNQVSRVMETAANKSNIDALFDEMI